MMTERDSEIDAQESGFTFNLCITWSTDVMNIIIFRFFLELILFDLFSLRGLVNYTGAPS